MDDVRVIVMLREGRERGRGGEGGEGEEQIRSCHPAPWPAHTHMLVLVA